MEIVENRVFLLDKVVAGGLDDWEVKIADFVVLLAKVAKKVPGTLSSPQQLNGDWIL